MVTNGMTSKNPVFNELATILQSCDYCPNPADWEFTKCPAKVDNARQCRKDLSRTKTPKAKELWGQFQLMKEFPETDEFFDQLVEFLTNSHCHPHYKKAVAAFNEWREIHATNFPLSPDQPATISDIHSPKFHGMSATTQRKESLITESTRTESSSGKKFEVHTRVETVTSSISTIKLDDPCQTSTTDNYGDGDAAKVDHVNEIGLENVHQKGLLFDHFPVFHEIDKPLTSVQMEKGVIYVLEHETKKGMFKMGCTRETTKETPKQAGDCYAFPSNPIHVTSGGPFFAASKAEKLAQTVLKYHNIAFKECTQCGGAHMDWFDAPREMVLATVKAMENFILLPAYELRDDKVWGLSFAAREAIKNMWESSLPQPKSTTDADSIPIGETDANLLTQWTKEGGSHFTETIDPISSQSSNESIEANTLADTIETGDSGQGVKGEKGANGAKPSKRRSGWKGVFSRENTPELDSDSKTEKSRQEDKWGTRVGDVLKAVANLLPSMRSDNMKSRESDVTSEETPKKNRWKPVI